jgi:hypothetical protein
MVDLPDSGDTLIDQANDLLDGEVENVQQKFEESLKEITSESEGRKSSLRQTAVEEVAKVFLVLGEGNSIQTWIPVEMVVERSMYDDIDTVKFVGITGERGASPIFDPENIAQADGSGESIKARAFGDSIPSHYLPGGTAPQYVNSYTKLFEGEVANVFDKGNGTWFIRCTNVMSTIVNRKIDLSIDEETKVSTVVESVFREAEIPVDQYIIDTGDGELTNLFRQATQFVEDQTFLGDDTFQTDNLITADYTNKTVSKVLGKIARKSNNVWWVTRNNQVYFGPPAGDVLGPDDESSFQMTNYITSSDAGKQQPPYRSVRVIGDGVVSQDGWDSKNMVSSDKLLQSYGMSPAIGTPDVELTQVDRSEGLQEPTFTFRSREIKTQEQADKTAKKILDELLNQTKGGNVTMVGRSYVKPHDKLKLPDRFGGGEYLVNKVTHNFNSSDGFVTVVECGGLTTKDKAFYQSNLGETVQEIPEAEQVMQETVPAPQYDTVVETTRVAGETQTVTVERGNRYGGLKYDEKLNSYTYQFDVLDYNEDIAELGITSAQFTEALQEEDE